MPIQVPWRDMQGVGGYNLSSLLSSVGGYTDGLVVPFRKFCTTDYVSCKIEVKIGGKKGSVFSFH